MGKLIDSALAEKGEVTFHLAPDQHYRVLIGPDLLEAKKEPPHDLANRLAQAKAAIYDITPQLKQETLRAALPKYIWYCWGTTYRFTDILSYG